MAGLFKYRGMSEIPYQAGENQRLFIAVDPETMGILGALTLRVTKYPFSRTKLANLARVISTFLVTEDPKVVHTLVASAENVAIGEYGCGELSVDIDNEALRRALVQRDYALSDDIATKELGFF